MVIIDACRQGGNAFHRHRIEHVTRPSIRRELPQHRKLGCLGEIRKFPVELIRVSGLLPGLEEGHVASLDPGSGWRIEVVVNIRVLGLIYVL